MTRAPPEAGVSTAAPLLDGGGPTGSRPVPVLIEVAQPGLVGPLHEVCSPTQTAGGASSGQRTARFTAEMIALNEAVVIEGSIPTPQITWSRTSHSTYAAAVASPPSDRACSA